MKLSVLGGLIALGLSMQGATSGEDRKQDAWIVSTPSADALTLQAHARLESGESGHYRLIVRKSGQSGVSVTRQTGSIPTGDGLTETGPLVVSKLSFRSGETLEAELIVETSTGRKIRDLIRLTNTL